MTFKNFGKNWWFFKILAKIEDFSKFWVHLKNHHFFQKYWKIIIFLPKLRKIFILCQNFKKLIIFFPKFWKKHHFPPKNHFYQSLIVSHKYPILVSNILVSNSIQYWYQILACLWVTEVVYVGTQPSIHFYILCYL